MVSYLDETALNRLCGYVAEYYLLDTLPKVEPIKVDSQLKTIDIMHFGWNIGKAFSILVGLFASCSKESPLDGEQYYKQVYIVGAYEVVQQFDVAYGDGPQNANHSKTP